VLFIVQKKFYSQALVAKAGGNQKKYEKMEAQAKELLEQDWYVSFMKEEPPSLNEL
jgi:hypothetical protein